MKLVYNYNWLLSAWIIMVLIIAPWGEFCINDDWAYAKGVENLNNGTWQYSNWQGMPFFTQQVWGLVWVKIFGFSFTVLRFSSIFMGALGLFFMIKSLRLLTTHQNAFWMTCLIGFNPLYIHLSTSFMTDIPCLAMSLGGFLYLMRFKLSGRLRYLWPAFFLLLAGILIRQFAVIFPIAFVIGAIWKIKTNFIKIIFYTLISGALLYLLSLHNSLTIHYQGTLPRNYGFQFKTIQNLWLDFTNIPYQRIAYYGYNALIFIGLGLAPMTLKHFKYWPWKKALAFGLLIFVGALKIIFTDNYWPLTGDIIYPVGLGTIFLDGYHSVENPTNTVFAATLGISIMVIASYSLANIIGRIEKSGSNLRVELVTIVLISIVPLVILYVSDRYLIFGLTFAVFAIARVYHLKVNRWLFGVMATITLLFNMNHFNFQKSRTALIEFAIDDGGSAQNINGGFEFNAWHNFDINNYHPERLNWWWVEDDKYVVKLTEHKAGYHVIKQDSYVNWITFRKETIYLLKRENHATSN
ncbi:MAG: glycosyltransferase family 39 protein [Flavobacteriales bacterium]|nr:glycosyltransferase family 39 protein [Flavobacteriales bacterium]